MSEGTREMASADIAPADGADVAAALREAAQERILVLDGAMGTEIQALKLSEEDFRGERVKTFALALRLLHEGRVDLKPLVTHRFALTDYKRAIQTALATGPHRSVKTVFDAQRH